MFVAFSAKLLASQLPVLARRCTLLKRVMFAGIGLGLACLTSTLYFNYSASDLNAVSNFSYDIPQSLITWSQASFEVKPSYDDVEKTFNSHIYLIPVVVMVFALIFLAIAVLARVMRDESFAEQMPLIMFVLLGITTFGSAYYLFVDDLAHTPDSVQELVIAQKKHDAEALIKYFNEHEGIWTDPATKPVNVSLMKEDLNYLEFQKNIKDGDDIAETNMQFVSSNYFINNRASFKPDTLTAIEKATYGHPVSERAKQYQISTIEPAIRKQHMRAHISASLMAIGFLTGVSAFVLYRGMRKRMKLLKNVSFVE